MNLADYAFVLPKKLIAQKPASPRDQSRLLVLDKTDNQYLHLRFHDLPTLLNKDDVLVFNQTKVFPARLFATKVTGGKVEILLLNRLGSNTYQAISRPGLRLHQSINFDQSLNAEVVKTNPSGILSLKFNQSNKTLDQTIDKIGHTPLPPYIHSSETEQKLRHQYQTIYAKERGSAAAPTAGLHFTPSLLKKLKEKGIGLEYVTLHVGLGTFKPVTDKQIRSGQLHRETFTLDQNTADKLNQSKKGNKRIIAVGTTTTRVLESCVDDSGQLVASTGDTRLFIRPPYRFKFIDALITNFHLPQSSLLMLVTALACQPNTPHKFSTFLESPIGRAYQEAIKKNYHFYSFGDAMFIT